MKRMNKAKKTVMLAICVMIMLLPGLSVSAAEGGIDLNTLSAWLSFDVSALNRTQTPDGFALFYSDDADTTVLTDGTDHVTALTLAAGNVCTPVLTDPAELGALLNGSLTVTAENRSAVSCLMKGMALYCAFGGAAQSMETMAAAVRELFAGERTVDVETWRIRAYINEEAGAVILTVRPLEAAR